MIDREEMTDVAFEMLKLLFFVTTYFLIVNSLKTNANKESFDNQELYSFYSTLFIFSATTWIDYLSAMKDSIRDGYIYDGKYKVSTNICVLGASVGFITTFISLMCVFLDRSDNIDLFAGWGAIVYWISLMFLGLKAFVISDMVIHVKKDWSKEKSLFDIITIVFIIIAMAVLVFHIKVPSLYLLMLDKKMIPCFVMLSIFIGILIGYLVNYCFREKVFFLENELIDNNHILDDKDILTEQSFLEIQNETDGKMPYDDMEFDWIIKKEKENKKEKSKSYEEGDI